jgi:ATP-dependent Clp protease adaptor protein ClpS
MLIQKGSFMPPTTATPSTISIADPEVKEPSLYVVLLHNDDYTPMEFVVQVLRSVFRMDANTAEQIMLDVHEKGVGRCGIYPYDVAETKVTHVDKLARDHEYPLRCTMTKA